jgi:methionyl aminopeptidase
MEKEVVTLDTGVNVYNESALEKLKEAGLQGKEIRSKLVEAAIVGNTTRDIENLAEDLIQKSGGSPLFKGMYGYPYCTCVSNNEQVVHGFPTSRKLKKGDVLSIDFGLRHSNGYCTDSARTSLNIALPISEVVLPGTATSSPL